MAFIEEKYTSFMASLSPRRVFALLFSVGFVVYMNSFIGGMFWDDYDSVTNNAYIRSFSHLPDFFTRNLTAGSGITDNYWRPLLLVSFATDYSVGGLEPFFYHFQNFAWHLAASMLVYLVGVRLFPKKKIASLIASLLFLVHPLQTEAVTYVAGRADPMHTTLMLGSFLFFLRHVGSKKYSDLLWSLALFILSLLSKERAIVFPVILALVLFLVPLERYACDWKKRLFLLTPYVTVVGIYALLRMTVLHFTDTFDPGATTILHGATMWEKILVFLAGLGTYGKLIVWPARLYMEKSLPVPQSVLDPTVLLGIAILIVSTFLIFSSLKRNRIIAFCLLAFFVTLLPSMYVYPVQGLLYEHWLYPAFPWLFFVIGIGVSAYLEVSNRTTRVPPIFLVPAIVIVLCAFGIRTMIRNFDWQNPVRFYEKNVSLGGVSGRVYTNLGMAYDDSGRHDEAIAAYRSAIESSGNTLFQPWYDLGNTLSQLGRPDEALEAYRQSLAIHPRFVPTYTNMAKIYADRNDVGTAIRILKDAETDDPDQIRLLYAIAAISANSGDTDTARTYAQKILTIDPNNDQAKRILSFARSRTK